MPLARTCLSPEEKAAGRVFRDDAQSRLLQLFEADPPTHLVMNFWSVYRHLCSKRQNRSTALELKEKYELSPEFRVLRINDEYSVMAPDDDSPAAQQDPGIVHGGVYKDTVETYLIPAGRFGFIYKEGRCKGCGQTARSRAGQFVDAWQRPPVTGRVAR